MKHFQAPLPFQGQKRFFLKEVSSIIEKLPNNITIVDCFGGSGLLSHRAKKIKPNATIIYNDFDNYTQRIQNITQTNQLIQQINNACLKSKHLIPKEQKIPQDTKTEILKIPQDTKTEILKIIKENQDKHGFVDFITISSSLLYSGSYATDFNQLEKYTFYNNIILKQYSATGYLDGVITERLDYKEIFEKYKNHKNTLFIIDPPYLSTKTEVYNNKFWKISDYLDVLNCLHNQKFIYFTSERSELIDLLNWLSNNTDNYKNPILGANIIKRKNQIGNGRSFTDILIENTNLK